MADDVRQALEEYAGRTAFHDGVKVWTVAELAPEATDAMRAALDYADDLERLAYDKWMGVAPRDEPRRSHYIGVMGAQAEAADGIRKAILSALTGDPAKSLRDDPAWIREAEWDAALTDSPDMAMEDR